MVYKLKYDSTHGRFEKQVRSKMHSLIMHRQISHLNLCACIARLAEVTGGYGDVDEVKLVTFFMLVIDDDALEIEYVSDLSH